MQSQLKALPRHNQCKRRARTEARTDRPRLRLNKRQLVYAGRRTGKVHGINIAAIGSAALYSNRRHRNTDTLSANRMGHHFMFSRHPRWIAKLKRLRIASGAARWGVLKQSTTVERRMTLVLASVVTLAPWAHICSTDIQRVCRVSCLVCLPVSSAKSVNFCCQLLQWCVLDPSDRTASRRCEAPQL